MLAMTRYTPLGGLTSILMKVGELSLHLSRIGTKAYPIVYNHVLRLDMATKKWNLVDNYGDIPGVRMGEFSSLENSFEDSTHNA
jgi:hypothetical protein